MLAFLIAFVNSSVGVTLAWTLPALFLGLAVTRALSKESAIAHTQWMMKATSDDLTKLLAAGESITHVASAAVVVAPEEVPRRSGTKTKSC